MFCRVLWDIHVVDLADVDDVGRILGEATNTVGPTGDRCVAYLGPPLRTAAPELAVGIDSDHGRAVLRWLPDPPLYGVDLSVPAHPDLLSFYAGNHDIRPDPVWTCRPAMTRIRPVTARQAVHEYATSGQRPTCVQWATDST